MKIVPIVFHSISEGGEPIPKGSSTVPNGVRVIAGPSFLEELQASEFGAYEDSGSEGREDFALLAPLCESPDRKIGKPAYYDLPDATAKYILTQLDYHIDKWSNWGWEGASFIRTGRALEKHLDAYYPDTLVGWTW